MLSANVIDSTVSATRCWCYKRLAEWETRAFVLRVRGLQAIIPATFLQVSRGTRSGYGSSKEISTKVVAKYSTGVGARVYADANPRSAPQCSLRFAAAHGHPDR